MASFNIFWTYSEVPKYWCFFHETSKRSSSYFFHTLLLVIVRVTISVEYNWTTSNGPKQFSLMCSP